MCEQCEKLEATVERLKEEREDLKDQLKEVA